MEKQYLCEVKWVESKANEWVDMTCLHRAVLAPRYIVTAWKETILKCMSVIKRSNVFEVCLESENKNPKTVGKVSS